MDLLTLGKIFLTARNLSYLSESISFQDKKLNNLVFQSKGSFVLVVNAAPVFPSLNISNKCRLNF